MVLANALNRITKDYRESVDMSELTNPENLIRNPDLTLVAHLQPRYWKISINDEVTPMSEAEMDVVDAYYESTAHDPNP